VVAPRAVGEARLNRRPASADVCRCAGGRVIASPGPPSFRAGAAPDHSQPRFGLGREIRIRAPAVSEERWCGVATTCFSSTAVSRPAKLETGSKLAESVEHLLRRKRVADGPVGEPMFRKQTVTTRLVGREKPFHAVCRIGLFAREVPWCGMATTPLSSTALRCPRRRTTHTAPSRSGATAPIRHVHTSRRAQGKGGVQDDGTTGPDLHH
jgi:hypothetical protein